MGSVNLTRRGWCLHGWYYSSKYRPQWARFNSLARAGMTLGIVILMNNLYDNTDLARSYPESTFIWNSILWLSAHVFQSSRSLYLDYHRRWRKLKAEEMHETVNWTWTQERSRTRLIRLRLDASAKKSKCFRSASNQASTIWHHKLQRRVLVLICWPTAPYQKIYKSR